MATEEDSALGLSARIAPMLAGHPPSVQGAALADLVAIYLHGHRASNEGDTARLRSDVLAAMVKAFPMWRLLR